MWRAWLTLALVTCACGGAAGAAEAVEEEQGTTPPRPSVPSPTTETTPRPPPRTLDRQAAELAWRTWLQSPESRDPNAPPRRITTKSLFITPLVCPKGQRLDREGCVQTFTVDKEEHERYLLEQLNALFTSAPGGDVMYDYGDEEPGPLQLSLPIALDPLALQAQEPSAQAQQLQPNYVQVDKKQDQPNNNDMGIVAELELLKLESIQKVKNNKTTSDNNIHHEHNMLNNYLLFSDKPKRDSAVANMTSNETAKNSTDDGQKEVMFGDVSVDPILYITEYQNQRTNETTAVLSDNVTKNNKTINATHTLDITNTQINNTQIEKNYNSKIHELKRNEEKTKLNPENEYSDIGEAIKLISRYAEVTTDDNFTKDQNKYPLNNDQILGTRTKLQHRRNKLKPIQPQFYPINQDRTLPHKGDVYYRYPWNGEHSPTPPPNYPFRHLQDYWPGQQHIGGVYNVAHENPRRHHHSYPHINVQPNSYVNYSGYPPSYPGSSSYLGQRLGYPSQRLTQPRGPIPAHGRPNNQDLYSLLGLRHWFSSKSTAKR